MKVGEKYGCLEILDNGESFPEYADSQIARIIEEKTFFLDLIHNNKLKCNKSWSMDDGSALFRYAYEPISFQIDRPSICSSDFDEAINIWLHQKKLQYYKCKCRKCGKIRYYSEETIQTSPDYCYRPVYISSKFTYSIKAEKAKFRQIEKYKNNASVCIVKDRNEVVPSDIYCDKWNIKRSKDLKKQAEKEASIIASLPRKMAENYDIDYTGITYESIEVLECVNEVLESIPVAYYNQRHQKKYHDITVYKQYHCRCYLCGNESLVTCDKFGIHPPTEYGYTAYNGYWSDVYCKCHHISSFQWIVNKLLIENNVNYRVEVTFPDLYGISGRRQLRFDFAVYDEDGSIKWLIECQGEQHFAPVDEFGGDYQFKKQIRNDDLKRKYADEHDISLIEISYKNKQYEQIEERLKKEGILK